MDNDTLVRIGRKHSKEEIIEAFYMAREAGFDNINMDIILDCLVKIQRMYLI